jgi:hypothetical protein
MNTSPTLPGLGTGLVRTTNEAHRFLEHVAFNRIPHSSIIWFGGCFLALFPVLVTGIQQRRVCGAEESFSPSTWAGWIPVTSTGMRFQV